MLAQNAVNAEVYRWTDESGNVHFSERKPTSFEAEALTIKNEASSDAQRLREALDKKRADKARQEKNNKQVTTKKTKQASDEQCKQVKNNLRALSLAMRVKKTDPQTQETIYLDDKMRKKEIEENKIFISEYCAQ